MHTHPVSFQIVSRQPYDTAAFDADGVVNLIDAPVAPESYESGWKDVVRCPSGWVTKVIVRFTGHTGLFPIHCHIVSLRIWLVGFDAFA